MKKYLVCLSTMLTIAAGMLLSGCEKWLDVPVESEPNTGNFWKSERDFSDALDACYTPLGAEEAYSRNQFAEQIAADDFESKKTGSYNAFRNLTTSGSESELEEFYKTYTTVLQQANRIVFYALKIENPSKRIQMHLGEAYFMRAFAHFLLAYHYGRNDAGFPYYAYEETQEIDDTRIPRQLASVQDNYKHICDDLDKAAKLLLPFSQYSPADYGRATRDAAIALKVKTLAYWAQHDPSKWELIPALVDRLESECERALQPTFAEVFAIENEWGKEFIFSCNNDAALRNGSFIAGIFLEEKAWGMYNGWGTFQPTLDLWAEFSEKDQRRNVSLYQYGDQFTFFGMPRKFYSTSTLETGFMMAKFMQGFADGVCTEIGKDSKGNPIYECTSTSACADAGSRPLNNLNVPIIRHAEMVLFKAEALIEQGKGTEAAEQLNRLTNRAGLGNVYSNATMQDLMHERRCELAGEFTDRFMDLKRWAAKYPEAKQKIEAPKHGVKHITRSDPNSPVDTINGKNITINGTEYKGVVVLHKGKTYNPNVHCVFPYPQQEIIKARGAIKQNPGY